MFGLYQPDAIASVKIKGRTYLLTANEGDTRADWPGYQEEARVGDAALRSPTPSLRQGANADIETNNDKLGRLTVSIASGNTDADADYEQIHVPGARSFSIWSDGAASRSSTAAISSSRSSPRPTRHSSTATTTMTTSTTAATTRAPSPRRSRSARSASGSTRSSASSARAAIVIYDITDPTAPAFVQYTNSRVFDTNAATPLGPDSGPEKIVFVEAQGQPERPAAARREQRGHGHRRDLHDRGLNRPKRRHTLMRRDRPGLGPGHRSPGERRPMRPAAWASRCTTR